MDFTSIAIIAVVIIVLWKFSDMFSKSAELATKEFDTMARKQDIRLHKARIADTKEVLKIKDAPVMSDKEFSDIFNVINTKDEE
jgi:uncharacterized membrane protein YvbJ